MPNLYARQTALSNVTGRIDYISNPSRQEHLLASYDGAADLCDGAYWQLLAAECNEAQKYTGDGKNVVQGREINFALSNALLPVEKMDTEEGKAKAKEICETLEKEFEKKYGRPCIVALHYNKAKNNLHVHLVYPERELLREPIVKVASRSVFYDEQGKRHYKKSEIVDPETKQLRAGCRMVKKGEVYERRYFSAADPQFASKSWLKDMKTNWLLPLRNGKLKGDVEITEYDPKSGKLPQLHIGTVQRVDTPEAKAITEQIEAYNASVREWNALVDKGEIPPGEVKKVQEEVRKAPIKGTLLPEAIERIKKLVAVITQTIAEVREKLRNRPKAKAIAGKIKTVRKQKKEKTDAAQELREAADRAFLGIGAGKKRAAADVLDDEIEALKSTESKLTRQYATETGLTAANLATLTKKERRMVMYRLPDDQLRQMAKCFYPPLQVINEYPEAQRRGIIADLEVSAAAARELRNRRLLKPEDKVYAEELLEEKAEREKKRSQPEPESERESQLDKLHQYQTKTKSRGERQEPSRDDEWGER